MRRATGDEQRRGRDPDVPSTRPRRMAHERRVAVTPAGNDSPVNPFDVLTLPPAMAKRALEDLHEIAQLVRRYMAVEDDILVRVSSLEKDLRAMRAGVERLGAEIVSVRSAVVPLSDQIAVLSESLGQTGEAVAPLSGQIATLNTTLTETRHSVAPLS